MWEADDTLHGQGLQYFAGVTRQHVEDGGPPIGAPSIARQRIGIEDRYGGAPDDDR